MWAHILLSGRKLWIGGSLCEGPEFESLALGLVVGGGVEVTLAEYDHPDVRVQIDLTRLRAGHPVTNNVVVVVLTIVFSCIGMILSSALSGKMLIVTFVKNNKIDD